MPSEEETLDLHILSHSWCLWMTSVSLFVCHTTHCFGTKLTNVFQSNIDCWSPTLLHPEESMEGRAEWLTPQMSDHLCYRVGERRGLWEFCKLKFALFLLVELYLPKTDKESLYSSCPWRKPSWRWTLYINKGDVERLNTCSGFSLPQLASWQDVFFWCPRVWMENH